MNRKVLIWLLVLPALCGFSFLGSYYGSSIRRGEFSILGRHRPILECPELLDLGEQEAGELVLWPFTIANRGNQELVIDEIEASCSCSGLVFLDNPEGGAISNLTVGPAEEVNLALRLSVPWQPGNPARYAVQFRTNEAGFPLKRIVAETSLIKGVLTSPVALALGSIPKGSSVRRIVEIHDRGGRDRSIERVTSTIPDRLEARLLLDEGEDAKKQISALDWVIGRVEVSLRTDELGPIDGVVQVQVTDKKRPVSVPVFAEVVSDLLVTPSSLLLPRKSGRGVIYQADCVCRVRQGELLTVSLAEADEGLKVEFLPSENDPGSRNVRITLDPMCIGSATQSPKKIKIKARAGDREELLEIRVHCRFEGKGDEDNRNLEKP